MKCYLIGIVKFWLVWVGVSIGSGLLMLWFFPPEGRQFLAGVGLDWRTLPGTVLGLFAAIRTFRSSIRVIRR